MSCGAKLPIYALFCAAFFERYQAFVMTFLYTAGILLGIFSCFVLKKTFFKGAPAPFVMELPNYRFPSAKAVLLLIWQRTRDFVRRAFTVILFATVAIWFLQSFDLRLNPTESGADSILAYAGRALGAVFTPIGITDWRASAALVTGFTAKEAVVSTLSVLMPAGETLAALFTPLSAFAFLVFTLLYTPCVAAVSTVRREFGSVWGAVLVVIYQTCFAWAAAFAVCQTGRLFRLT